MNVTLKAGLEIHQQLDSGKLFCKWEQICRGIQGWQTEWAGNLH